MRRSFGTLIFLAFLVFLAWLFFWPLVKPSVEQAQRSTVLLSSPAPTALPNPLPGRPLTDTWGGARSGGRKHEGIDIFAPRDTPIRATTEGIVLNVGPNTLGGRTVMILGPGGQRHYYAHLDRYPALTAGEWVNSGDVVGYVGDSGNAKGTPTHLHYGIYTAAGAINPYPLLAAGRK
ncbi:M23 family metallopeptidase [Deinococcus sp. PESE-13]